MRKKLQQKYKVKKLGVLITDSRTMPLRSGITGVALGYAGFAELKTMSGRLIFLEESLNFHAQTSLIVLQQEQYW